MYTYNIKEYGFRNLVSNLFRVYDLEKIHKIRKDLLPNEPLNIYTESSTKFHDKFYSKLNNNWPEFYEIFDNFIHNEVVKIIEEPFHYQKWPTFRVHIPNDQAIHTWHFDGDPLNKHPPGEINFFLPLTKCYGNKINFVDSLKRSILDAIE